MPLLFIYGTLKTGCRNAGMMAGARQLGLATTQNPVWKLGVITDPYPFPVLTTGNDQIQGELYDASTQHLERLDAFELTAPHANPPDYVRTRIELITQTGEIITAQSYVAHESLVNAAVFCHPQIIRENNLLIWREIGDAHP